MNKKRAAELLAQGMSLSGAASILGVTVSYLSQLAKQPDFVALIEETRTSESVKEITEDDEDKRLTNKYTAIENRILDAIDSQLGLAELPALTNTLKVVSERQEKRASRKLLAQLPSQNVTNVQIVQIAVPARAMPAITLNEQKEVIAIDARPMAPMASTVVQDMFKKAREERELLKAEKIEKLA